MKRKKKVAVGSLLAWFVLFAAIAAGAYWIWQNRARFQPPSSKPVTATTAAGESRQQLKGKLLLIKPPHDPNIGITVQAAALLRSVSMYQWQEQCNGNDCSYALGWSAQHIDSQKFHTPAGHENARAPFVNARFIAGEMRVDDVVVDPALMMTRAPVDYPVAASALPPNLAASFSVVDGALYAGGDPAHPTAGMMRIVYRIIPAGEVELTGTRRGDRLEAQ